MFEKILGKNYKYWYLACNAFKSATSYRVSNMAWLGSRVLTLLISIYIWKLTSEAGSNLIGFGEIFTYYIIGGIFSLIFLHNITIIIWKAGLKRNEAVGL